MNLLVMATLAVVAGFWIGAVPFGVIVGKLIYKRDIRTEGSGNIGAANALRSLGKAGAALVLVLDALKGALPVVAVNGLGGPTAIAALGGAAAVVGHCLSPFLRGRGGKGVATSYGVIWALAWPAAIAFTLIWVAVVMALGYASVASMLASAAMSFALWFMLGRTGMIYGIASAIFIVYKHRDNLSRLRAGTEHPLTWRQRSVAASRDTARRAPAPQTRKRLQ